MLVLGSLEFLQGEEDTEIDLNSQLGPQCYCPGNEYAKLIPELAEAISKGFSLMKKLRCGSDGSSFFSSTIDCRCLAYRISANSFRGNYSFLNLALCTVTKGVETIQGQKLFVEIRYST